MAPAINQVKGLFIAALEKETPAERNAYLDETCAENPLLRQRVEALLKAHEESDEFLEVPAAELLARRDAATNERANAQPKQIISGRYELIEQIGEGGIGTVWLAQQHEPVKRLVAMKLIKPGMDSRLVLTRFEIERQSLARMDHPNIAKVFDAGVTPEGRPYFVMELVRGISLHKYCDQHQLTLNERLELFIPVCQAIQHAHQKGIIHRDIKPSNVLIAEYDGKAVPKVIDFGVAKAMSQEHVEESQATMFNGIVGTPLYMSPEQATFNNVDIDTRSDIYSLGNVLHELLISRPPISFTDYEQKGIIEVLRIVREDDVRPPSEMIQGSPHRHSIAANRQTDLKQLVIALRNELDWIVLKAVEKDRNRRYQSANDFAADIQRYLQNEPVLAHPPSQSYRLRKFLRKHRGMVLSAGLLITMLISGMFTFASLAKTAQSERNQANDERDKTHTALGQVKFERDRAILAEGEAQQRALELEKVAEFQRLMLAQVSAAKAGNELFQIITTKQEAAMLKLGIAEPERRQWLDNFTVRWSQINGTDTARLLIDRTILKPAIDVINTQFADQPLLTAQLTQAIADQYRDLDLLSDAQVLQDRALDIRKRLLGDEHLLTLVSMNNAGFLLHRRGKLIEAEAMHRQTLEIRRRVLGPDNPFTINSLLNLANVLNERGQYSQAEPFNRQVVEQSTRILGPDHRSTLRAINNLISSLQNQNKFTEAEPLLNTNLEKLLRLYGEDDAETLAATIAMGLQCNGMNHRDKAESYFRKAYERSKLFFGETHSSTFTAQHNLGVLLFTNNKKDEGLALLRDEVARMQILLGADHPQTLNSIVNLAGMLGSMNKFAEAENVCGDMVEQHRKQYGQDHPLTIRASAYMGRILQSQNQFSKAEPYLRAAYESLKRTKGNTNPETHAHLRLLADSLHKANNLSDAADCYHELVLHNGDLHALHMSMQIAGTFVKKDDSLPAMTLLKRLEEPAKKLFIGEHVRSRALFEMILGQCQLRQQLFTAAEQNLLNSHTTFSTVVGPTDRATIACKAILLELYTAWNAKQPGKGYDAKANLWR